MDHATRNAALTGRGRIARRIGWIVVSLLIAAISIEFLLTVYGKYHDPAPGGAYAMFWSRRGWLWTHLAGGVLAIVLGPLQFLTRKQKTYPRLHRWMGRVYMVGILIACTGATGLIATSQAPLGIRAAFASTALAWLTTALAALIAIRQGRVSAHRRWMIRNYLVTLSPITFRIFLQAHLATGSPPSPAMVALLLWMSWLLPLLIYEAGHRVAGLRRAASARRTRIATHAAPRLDAGAA
ncbi:DUF2306 domain-containing protein [Luteimonas aquatica]|uniref:DUF2306 domain-containing protein n=1 Tax=Luteimonas aquatica TaxID=450364 RepID=UPI001F59C707|nr:DUF2306 domain-containing protein [Luteimonas aquatica]